jgi:ABC-type tungstate transport system permease subunit
MAINPEKVTTAKIEMADNLINWLLSAEVQRIIRAYGVAEYGKSLFHPISDASTVEGFPTINTSPAQYQQ